MGRKTKYKDAYSHLLLEHMKDGNSYTSFAAKIGVHIDTLYEWKKKFPEFSETKKIASTSSQSFWEDIGRDMALSGNFGAWKFIMKNRFGWRDSHVEAQNEITEIKLVYDDPRILEL